LNKIEIEIEMTTNYQFKWIISVFILFSI